MAPYNFIIYNIFLSCYRVTFCWWCWLLIFVLDCSILTRLLINIIAYGFCFVILFVLFVLFITVAALLLFFYFFNSSYSSFVLFIFKLTKFTNLFMGTYISCADAAVFLIFYFSQYNLIVMWFNFCSFFFLLFGDGSS